MLQHSWCEVIEHIEATEKQPVVHDWGTTTASEQPDCCSDRDTAVTTMMSLT